jgi:hypothetical protein
MKALCSPTTAPRFEPALALPRLRIGHAGGAAPPAAPPARGCSPTVALHTAFTAPPGCRPSTASPPQCGMGPSRGAPAPAAARVPRPPPGPRAAPGRASGYGAHPHCRCPQADHHAQSSGARQRCTRRCHRHRGPAGHAPPSPTAGRPPRPVPSVADRSADAADGGATPPPVAGPRSSARTSLWLALARRPPRRAARAGPGPSRRAPRGVPPRRSPPSARMGYGGRRRRRACCPPRALAPVREAGGANPAQRRVIPACLTAPGAQGTS